MSSAFSVAGLACSVLTGALAGAAGLLACANAARGDNASANSVTSATRFMVTSFNGLTLPPSSDRLQPRPCHDSHPGNSGETHDGKCNAPRKSGIAATGVERGPDDECANGGG